MDIKKLMRISVCLLLGTVCFFLIVQNRPSLFQTSQLANRPGGKETIEQMDKRENVWVDRRFQGSQLAENYYEFSIIDFDTFILRKRPFLLFFYAQGNTQCEDQDHILGSAMNNGRSHGEVAFRLHFQDEYTTQPEKNIAAAYKIAIPCTFVSVDNDTNGVAKVHGMQKEKDIENLFAKIDYYLRQ